MSSQRAPGRGTQEAANIREKLKAKFITWRDRNQDNDLYIPHDLYVPHHLLSEWVTRDDVGNWISSSQVVSCAEEKFRDRIMDKALRTFCILIEIEREDAICYFFEKARSRLGPDMAVLALGHSKDNVKNFVLGFEGDPDPWLGPKCQEFCDTRRKYFAASLEYGEIQRLDEKDILPFRWVGKPCDREGTKLYSVGLDAAYLDGRPDRLQGQTEIPMMIKQLPRHSSENEDRIMRHLQAHIKQPHPHIVPLFGVFIQKDCRHLMMPLCDGDLSELLGTDKQAEEFSSGERYLSEMLNLADAVRAVHKIDRGHPLFRQTGVHHDLKPSNILLSRSSLILSDFGLATMRSPTVSSAQESYGHRSWYLAPETLWDPPWMGQAGPESDVFSLGCTFLEFLVHMRGKAKAVLDFRIRRRPKQQSENAPFWVGEKDQKRLSDAVEGELAAIAEDVESPKRARYGSVVREMLEVDVDERPDIEEIVEKLQKIQNTDGVAPSSANASNDGHFGELSGHPGQLFNQSKVGASVDGENPRTYAAGSHSATGGSHLSKNSDKTENSTEPTAMAELVSQLGNKCDHKNIYQKLLRTVGIPRNQHPRIKMLWNGKQWISNWAKASTSPVLILRGENRPYDREILSCVSSHIIKDALQYLPTGNMVMIVLHHFCHENRDHRDEAVTVMMQSLIRQLLSTPSGPGVLPSLKSNLSTSRLEDLWEMLSNLVQALSPHTRVVCIIDGLQAYCKHHIQEKRAEDMEWLIPRFIEVASGRQGVACRFKLFLTTSEVLPATNTIAVASAECRGQSYKIDCSKLGNQELRDSFWMGNKLGWA